MTKKLVSLLFIIALVATSIFIMNPITNQFSYEYKSNSVSLVNQASTQSSDQTNNGLNKLSAVDQARIITYPAFNTNFTTDKSEYKPGDNVNVTAKSTIAGFNGSLSWSITTPMSEQVFSPTKSANSVFFDDPQMKNTSVNDWQFTTPANYNKTVGFLNLTTSSQDTLYYNKYNDIKGTFDLSINYNISSTTGNFTVYYFDGSTIQSINSTSSPRTYPTSTLTKSSITLDTTNSSYIPLNITLNASGPTRFIIYSVSLTYHLANIDFSDGSVRTGTLNNIFVHGSSVKDRDLIKVSYFINSSISQAVESISFNFTIPTKQIYIGEWQLNILINPKSSTNDPLTAHNFIIPVVVKYNVYFNTQRQYIYRGENLNITTGDKSIYKDETNITSIYSPGDKIIFVGQIYSNLTTNENLDSNYFKTVAGSLNSSTLIKGTEKLNYNETTVTSFASSNSFALTGFNTTLLPSNLQNNYTWIIATTIPDRGIYGQVNQTLQLKFKSSIGTTASNGIFYSGNLTQQTNLNSLNVKFDLNVSSYQIPFSRTYFLTEFFEGNFTVDTYHYNLTDLQAANNDFNQSYDWQLTIPKKDLSFTVYFKNNESQVLEQNITANLIADGQTFYFAGLIDANLNTENLYHIGINWVNPLFSDEKAAHNVEFSTPTNSNYVIKGTLTVQLPLETIQYRQGDNVAIPFNVTVDQLNNKPASGLRINATANSNDLQPVVIEKGGSFLVIMTLPESVPIGNYVIQIYKASTNSLLGTLNIQIIPHAVNTDDVSTVIPIIYSLFGSLLAIVVLLGFIVQILRFRR